MDPFGEFGGFKSNAFLLEWRRISQAYTTIFKRLLDLCKSWNEVFDQDSHKMIKFTLSNVKPPAQIIQPSPKVFSYFAIKSLKVTTLFYQNLF